MVDYTPRYAGLNRGSAQTEKRASERELLQGIRGCVHGWRLAAQEGDKVSAQVMGDRILALCGELEHRIGPAASDPNSLNKST